MRSLNTALLAGIFGIALFLGDGVTLGSFTL
jgi:hypothetical protein